MKYDIIALIAETGRRFGRHNIPSYAAAMAYHAIISLVPLLLFSIALASLVFGREAATGEVVTIIEQYVGRVVAAGVEDIIEANSQRASDSLIALIIAVCLAFYSASNVFRQLVVALDIVWEIERPSVSLRQGLVKWLNIRLRKYIVGFVMALGLVFALLISLIISFVGGQIAGLMVSLFPIISETLFRVFNFSLLPVILTGFCAVIFKVLPDREIGWGDVWVGATVTGVVLGVAEGLIGLYVSQNQIATFYGVAGSVVVLMLWVYFSAYVLLFGAEFTQVYATTYGSQTEPHNKKNL